MPLTLVWGKVFTLKKTELSTGGTYDKLFGVDGDTLGISWKSVKDMMAIAASHGVPESLWPVYPDCDIDVNVPLADVRAKSASLQVALDRVPSVVIEGDCWLSFIAGILQRGQSFFIMA